MGHEMPGNAVVNDALNPDYLIAMLQYALTDVRKLSERSARHLEAAITTLMQDTSVVMVPPQSPPSI
jgi:hypothetical protein